MDIIVLKKDNIKEIYKIEKEVYKDPWQKESFLLDIYENKYSLYIGLQNNKEIIGYAGAWYILNYTHITNIAVKKNFQNKGFGKLLLYIHIFISIKKNKNFIQLEVNTKNTKAIKLYKKIQFKTLKIIKNYYKKGEDAYLMFLALKEIDFYTIKNYIESKLNLNFEDKYKKLIEENLKNKKEGIR